MNYFDSHPTDSVSRSGAHRSTEKLTAEFERAMIAKHEPSLGYSVATALLEVVCAQAIARCSLLERDLARSSDRAPRSRDTGTPPAPTGAASELSDVLAEQRARRDTRPLGNVVRLPTRGDAA